MRSPASMDILQIDIHNRCFLKCSNCTRLMAHQTTKWEMNLDTFQDSVRSLLDWWQPGKIIGVIAGEPTLHTQFEELSRLFASLFGGPLLKNGRHPIGDFNSYAMERLYDRSCPRGLWTSFGAKFYQHMEVIHEVYGHWNPNDHQAGGKHQAMLIHRDDYCQQTGMKPDEWEANRDKCWVQNMWSASMNDKGAYFCEVAAAIDRLYFEGKSAWPLESRWWMRKPDDFKDQIHLCNYCSLAQPGPSQIDSLELDIISPKNLIPLRMVKSPAVAKDRFDLPWQHIEEKRTVETKDSYAGEFRVSPDNDSVRPKSVTCIITCVGRAEHLKQTLAHNAKLVNSVFVVSDAADAASFEAMNVTDGLVIPTICSPHVGDSAFNKGAMINTALHAIKDADWILLTDSDCFLPPNLPEFIKTHSLNPGCLYGCKRLHTKTPADANVFFRAYESDNNKDAEPNGYFQLFNRRAFAVRDAWPHVMSEAFCSAGGVDSWFLQQFPASKRIFIPELAVVHIEHGEMGSKWNGERRKCWRQLGIITPAGEIALVPGETCTSHKIRLTSTLDGDQVELDMTGKGLFPKEIIEFRKGSNGTWSGLLLFQGKPTQGCHIHIAYWSE